MAQRNAKRNGMPKNVLSGTSRTLLISKNIYLAKQLAAIAESDAKEVNFSMKSSQLPRKLVQEVIGNSGHLRYIFSMNTKNQIQEVKFHLLDLRYS